MYKISIKTTSYIISPADLKVMRARAAGVLAACALWLACLVAPVAAQTVAIVTDLTGKVAIQGAADRRDVGILSEISAGAKLQLEGSARLVVLYTASGEEYIFSGPALVEFRAGVPEALSGAKPQKKISAIGKSADIRIKTATATQAGYVMRSIRPAIPIKLLNPAGGKTLDKTPEFRWAEVQAGAQYQFDFTDETGRSLHEAQVTNATLQLPASVELIEGGRYTWQVSARLSDGRRYSGTADFSVATVELRSRAESLRPVTGAPVSERVAYAAWLEHESLKTEARRYWRELVAERPEDERLRALAAE